ncbi:MAG: hypothetical protein EB084_04570 [Proteobacteria bacterium]|nr:hypothetical protein [Pseudomonadota bacterium]
MAEHGYGTTPKGGRVGEVMTWLTLALMISFVVISRLHPAVRARLEEAPGAFTMGLAAMYLIFLISSRRVFRQKRLAGVRLSTNRRTLCFNDEGGEQIVTWRDVKSARIRVDVTRDGQAWARRFDLQGPKRRIRLDSSLVLPLSDAPGLVREICERVANVVLELHALRPFCPLCAGDIDLANRRCPSCAATVEHVSLLKRPWELYGAEMLYMSLLFLVIAPLWPGLYLFALVLLVGVPLRALLFAPAPPRPLSALPADAPSVSVPRTLGGVASVTLALLLVLAPAVAAPPGSPSAVPPSRGLPPSGLPAAPSATPSATPSAGSAHPFASPAKDRWNLFERATTSAPSSMGRLADYFPLALGNTWEYRSNYNRVVMRVTHQEVVNGVTCWVLESFVGDATESVQRESISVGASSVEVLKRVHGGTELFLDPPETLARHPLREGVHWTWQAPASQGSALLVFEIKGLRRLNVLGRDETALLVLIRGRSADGAEIQTKRWYCKGVGMVREQTVMKKSGQSTQMDAMLQNYNLRLGGSASE